MSSFQILTAVIIIIIIVQIILCSLSSLLSDFSCLIIELLFLNLFVDFFIIVVTAVILLFRLIDFAVFLEFLTMSLYMTDFSAVIILDFLHLFDLEHSS